MQRHLRTPPGDYSYIKHCKESARIRSFSGPYFPTFGLNTVIYGVSFRIQSEFGKIRTRKTLNTDTFHAVKFDSTLLWLPDFSWCVSKFLRKTNFIHSAIFLNYYGMLFNGIFRNKPLFTHVYIRPETLL